MIFREYAGSVMPCFTSFASNFFVVGTIFSGSCILFSSLPVEEVKISQVPLAKSGLANPSKITFSACLPRFTILMMMPLVFSSFVAEAKRLFCVCEGEIFYTLVPMLFAIIFWT